jgi:predicted glycogen debranching enzyme
MPIVEPRRVLIDGSRPERLVTSEWLVTNGLGGYASGTVGGRGTRRYHGLLVAALPNPLGRVMMWSALDERVRLGDGRRAHLGAPVPGEEAASPPELVEFALELGLPVWRWRLGDALLERRVVLPHGQNTVVVTYRLIDGAPCRLELRPAVHFRPHDAPVSTPHAASYTLSAVDDRFELRGASDLPPLRLWLEGARARFVVEARRTAELLYPIEESRGYDARGQLHSPGQFRAELRPGRPVALIGSTEPWDTIEAMTAAQAIAAEHDRRRALLAMAPPAARQGVAAELVLAADQFLVEPVGRAEDQVRARAHGDEARSIIAGYHWFTDWGRDAMISLEGLALCTGRGREAGAILRTFAHHLRDGLIPNLFPEGAGEGLYHTADATLWFVHAVGRYVAATDDQHTLGLLLPTLREIIRRHQAGTRFGIAVDPDDGLLRQGAPGYQLTWMDAKAGDWVVTPRRGKAVEINALWYGALRQVARWLAARDEHDAAAELAAAAERAKRSFNQRFWNPATGCLFDVVDGDGGDDPAVRPNQLFAVSLPDPVLSPDRWRAVLDRVSRDLVTPVGLRSLAPDHPDYKPSYHGDLISRDAAYHQGTVWSWLVGPYVDAWRRVHPERASEARRLLDGLIGNLGEAALGSVSEVFDAEPPYLPRGCVAQAWGVAELLRCLVVTAGEGDPP